jgi:hypothetical protein
MVSVEERIRQLKQVPLLEIEIARLKIELARVQQRRCELCRENQQLKTGGGNPPPASLRERTTMAENL